MKRIAWLSDIHLNFLVAAEVDRFLSDVAVQQPHAVLIGGDIGEAHNVCGYLGRISKRIDAPIYFVLGNHDFYRGSIIDTRQRVRTVCQEYANLHYLTQSDAVDLTPHVALVGHDGWADGRLGNYERSLVAMNDFALISELVPFDKMSRWDVLKSLADEAAAHIRRVLPLAFEHQRDAMLLTHVPPWREACWHEGGTSNDQWLPHFTCHAVGQAIEEFMAGHPDKRLTVLCGHSHGQGEAQPLANVQVLTAGAEYGHPAVARLFELDEHTFARLCLAQQLREISRVIRLTHNREIGLV